MRAIRAALLWTLGVAAMLVGLTPGGGAAPVTAPAPRPTMLASGTMSGPTANLGTVYATGVTAATRTFEPTSHGECPLPTAGSPRPIRNDRTFAVISGPPATDNGGSRLTRGPPAPRGA